MRFSISQAEFLDGVQTVHRAISTKSVLPPILSGICLEASSGRVTLKATDLEIGIECSLPANVTAEGATVLPARTFGELVRKLPAMEILVEEGDGGQIRISYGNSEALLNAYDAAEFPPLQEFGETVSFAVDRDRFIRAIRNVSIAASTDYARPIFTGILLEVEQGTLNLVATDTHRLVHSHFSLGETEAPDLSVVIPGKSMTELGRIIRPDGDKVRVVLDESKIRFETGDILVTSRLIEGKFVNYRQVIPEEHTTRIRLLARGFQDSLERAALLSRDDLSRRRHNTVKLAVREGQLELSSRSAEVGELVENLPIQLEGIPLEIGFNARYLLDALRVIESEEVTLDLTAELSPGILRPCAEGEQTLFLVLPIRLGA